MVITLAAAAFASGLSAPCPERFATGVVAYLPGPGVEPDWAEPRAALGAPDFVDGRGAVSLGNQVGDTATLTLEFGAPIVDGSGPDLHVYERGPSAEPTVVEVSVDGETWLRVGQIKGSVREVDLASNPALKGLSFQFVRLTGVRDGARGPWAGPDIDAVGLFNSCPLKNS